MPKVAMRTAEERSDFAGSEACARCHSDIAADHQDSHHAHTLTVVSAENSGDRFLRPSDIDDPKRDLAYKTGVQEGQCVLTARRGTQAEQVVAKLAVGSGKNATTYLGEYKNQMLELRLTYYSAAKRWHFSPGQQLENVSGGVHYPVGLVKEKAVFEGCFACHSTAAVRGDKGVDLKSSLLGVGCEACHGPGKAHIESMERGKKELKLARLGDLKPRLTQELCGQCHRSPAGDDLNDPFNRTQLPRLQGLALSQSLCFTNSSGKLTCLSCHPAHGDTKRTRPQYNAICASCHTGQPESHRECLVEPKGDCVSCHMPAQPVGMPTGLRYRTHWIRVWDNPEFPIPSTARRGPGPTR